MSHLSKATKLTYLRFHISVAPECPCACQQLAHLTNLQHLEAECVMWITLAGAQHLAQLTALTHLSLHEPGADDGTLSLLALKLTNLKHLEVKRLDSVPWGTGPMPVIGQLSNLTYLRLSGKMVKDTAMQGLNCRTGLYKLSTLVGFKSVGDEATTSFWAAVHRQHN